MYTVVVNEIGRLIFVRKEIKRNKRQKYAEFKATKLLEGLQAKYY